VYASNIQFRGSHLYGVNEVLGVSSSILCIFVTETCPSVESKDRPVCANECSSDDDCQHNRICCTNECGGRTCSDSVEFCKVRYICGSLRKVNVFLCR